ncbi:NADPH-dependent medium chain alcohol dehydrogenase [Mollisia scopiformis]|uniref:alcohol dehydrogenase (NADP(+)) n=1 Tax=Mollisia scopiformis TaxID=149040 RepID=A0A194WTY2_MOLSC|nr:NADPH-dependent medium chain alcohol dehydrogenase [Mollisia scopiformis]KUJ11420.1 NADPH-dependent medium chain alcohol dehydrogenase [Mollisia scopiformis]
MGAAPDQFEGFMIHDAKKWTEFKKEKARLNQYDVDIENECCGVCGSDVHTITGGWGDLATTPLCVGHEIIGKVLRVGSKVKSFKPGQRVGVGAQVQSCMRCRMCKSNNENYCPHMVDTYMAPYNEKGGNADLSMDDSQKPMKDSKGNQIFSQGGYSSHSRVHEQFVFPIPDNLPSEIVAPMMCAGLTVYSPLVRAGTGPGKKVAIVGIGGLGHFALIWAKALGAEVTAISHSPNKKEDALALGADHFVSSGDKNWAEPHAFEYDFVLNAADMTNEFDIAQYLSIININGEFHNVGLPDQPLPQFKAQVFASNGSKMGGSHIGSKKEALEMLQLASKIYEKGVKPKIETIDISEKGCSDAVQKVKTNKVRYRVTLTGFHKAFGTGKN